MNDAERVARARLGDAAAFGELVDRHRVAVYRAALAALGSREDAEDVAQDAFVTAWQRLESFRGDASFKTWLLTITWHQAINRRRTLSRWWRRIGHPKLKAVEAQDKSEANAGRVLWTRLAGVEMPSTDRSPEQAAADNELRRAIVASIRALPPKLRDALLLAQAGEYSYDEIAAMSDTPTGTIKWRVSEARRLIKKRLLDRGIRLLDRRSLVRLRAERDGETSTKLEERSRGEGG